MKAKNMTIDQLIDRKKELREILFKSRKDFDKTELETDDKADFKELQFIFKEIQEQVAELKEGRILSTKNRTLIKEILDIWAELKEKLEELYNATEPPQKEEKDVEDENEIEIEEEAVEVKQEQEGISKEEIEGIVKQLIKESLTSVNIKEMVNTSIRTAINRRLGKVE